MEWISVDDRLPESAVRGVHDAYPVLVITGHPGGGGTEWDIKTTAWINNRFNGYPAGATKVTHWMPLPAAPATNNEKG